MEVLFIVTDGGCMFNRTRGTQRNLKRAAENNDSCYVIDHPESDTCLMDGEGYSID